MRAIVLVDQNFGIGRDGEQILYLSDDLARFVRLTKGHVMIFGRKTMATFPQGLPLKGRKNLILSRSLKVLEAPDRDYKILTDLNSLFQELKELKEEGFLDSEFFVLGGASLYEQLLDYCSSVILTMVNCNLPADKHFPKDRLLSEFELKACSQSFKSLTSSGQEVKYEYQTYIRKGEARRF